jgi:hypothetical protein
MSMEQLFESLINPQSLIAYAGMILSFVLSLLQLKKSQDAGVRNDLSAKKSIPRHKSDSIGISINLNVRFDRNR